jgi:hypothetical protein
VRSDDHIARYSATIASIPRTRVYLRRHRTQSHMPAPELCGPIDSSVILQPACPNGVTAANMLYRVNEHRRSCKRLFHGYLSYFPVKPISSLRLKYYGSSEGFRNINTPKLPPVHPLLDPVSKPTIALVLSESNRSIQLLDTPLEKETKSSNTNIFNTIDRPTTPRHRPQ